MLKDWAKYTFPDKAKKNDLVFEVNYSPTETHLETIRWRCGNKIGFIERKHLFEFLWVIGKSKEQQKMIPQTVRKTRYIEKLIGLKAARDIKKGEMLNFRINLDVPLSEEELYSEIQRSKHSKIVKPL